jgi:RNA polymerase sigma-70 factor (ECF subfamily)
MVQQENERAFAVLFDRYKVFLLRHIYQRTQSETEAGEMLQNIFLSLWKNRNAIIIEDSLAPYLLGAARNSVLALYADSQRQLKREELLFGKFESVAYSAEAYMVAEELEQQLKREIAKMPATMKKAFELSRYEDLSVREIAAVLEVSEQTVKNNLTSALNRLRLKLTQLIHVTPFLYFLD